MKTVIIGGGLTGTVSAYELEKKSTEFLLLEQDNKLGGLCKTVNINGFLFDYTGHFLHFSLVDSYVRKFVFNVLKNNITKICRNAKIYTKHAATNNKLIPYPFQANIGFLHPQLRKKCLYDLLHAQLNKDNTDEKINNFEIWLKKNFGNSITELFFKPYNTKLWKTGLNCITTTWVEYFVPVPDIKHIFETAIFQTLTSKINYGYNICFYYPKFGGIQMLVNNIANLLPKSKILLSAKVVKIDTKKKVVSFIQNGQLNTVKYNKIISTIPLPEIGRIITDDKIKLMTDNLKYTGVICYNIAVNKPVMKGIHWIYFPDKDITFYRVGFYHNINKNLVPEKKGSIYVEVSCKNVDKISEKEVYQKVVDGLIYTGILRSKEEILFYNIIKIPYAYVIYDKYRDQVLSFILNRLKQKNVYSIGRYGSWKYSYMTENIKDAIETVKQCYDDE